MTQARHSVGVLGGAFNPPHVGHLALARAALSALALNELILVPTGEAPHKRIEPEPGPRVRLEMATLATDGEAGMRVSDLEVSRQGPSFAYRTLELLADELPGSQLTFVMGADVAAGLGGWQRPERVLELARIAVTAREGFDPAAVDAVIEGLGGGPSETVEMQPVEVSSSLVRECVAAGRPIRGLVPGAVEAFIAEHGLYAGAST